MPLNLLEQRPPYSSERSVHMKKRKRKSGGQSRGRSTVEVLRRRCGEIVGLTDAFCEAQLNEDYLELCREMVDELYLAGFPLDKGRAASWAGGIVHALGWVNFLHDPHMTPHMTSPQVAEGFGISQGTMMAKSKAIRDELDLIQLDPDWCTAAVLEDNPLAWTLEVDGFMLDIRMAPREMQEEAYRLGLIPYIPADRHELKPESESGRMANIIEFPSKPKGGSASNDDPESKREAGSLFDGLEQ